MRRVSQKKFHQVVAVLRSGGVALLPSDSCYGLVTPFRSRRGVARVLALKHRQDSKFVLVASSLQQVQKFFPRARSVRFTRVAKAVWPGPVSLVVSPRFSVRVPDFPLLRNLAQGVGQPLIATSANQSGQQPAYSITQAGQQLDLTQLDAVVDVGRLPQRKPSTVVKVTTTGVKVLRQGSFRVHRTLLPWQTGRTESVHVHG